MQFVLLWKGQGHPTTESIILHLSGTVQPNTVLLLTNSSKFIAVYYNSDYIIAILVEDKDININHVVPGKYNLRNHQDK